MTPSEFIYTVLLRPRPIRKLANAILRSILPRQVKIGGALITLNPEDPVVSGALSLRLYEREEIDFFRKHFRPEMNLIDVGANVGLYTGLALATPNFSGSILCVEPDTESRNFLAATIAANSREQNSPSVAVCDCAASDCAGTTPFFRNPENRGDNRIYADSLVREVGIVRTETLDALCEQHGIRKLDFLKIDVQGAEARVLNGAKKILAASPQVILMTEFWPQGLRLCGSEPEEYLASLCELGFSIFEANGRPMSNPENLIRTTSGRQYRNIYGFKGRP